jgi:hypothetical protein
LRSHDYSHTLTQYFFRIHFNIVAGGDLLVGSDLETTSAVRQQILNKQQLNNNDSTTTEERCFLRSPSRDKQDSWSNESVVEHLPAGNDVGTEVEGSPLLRSAAGKRLVKAD